MVYLPVIHEWLRLRQVLPVIKSTANRIGEGSWHVNKNIPPVIFSSRFNHQHFMVRIFTQSICQHTASRPASNNDCIKNFIHFNREIRHCLILHKHFLAEYNIEWQQGYSHGPDPIVYFHRMEVQQA